METKTNTKTYGILSMDEMHAVKAGNGTLIDVLQPGMVKDGSITLL